MEGRDEGKGGKGDGEFTWFNTCTLVEARCEQLQTDGINYSAVSKLDESLVAIEKGEGRERGGRGEGEGRGRGGRVVPGLLGILESWMEVSLD